MAPHRVRRTLLLAALGLTLAATLTACTDAEGVHSDGPMDDVTAPLTLWPDTVPSHASAEQRPGTPTTVDGVPKVPSGDMDDADALEVVKADIAESGRTDKGSGRLVSPQAVKRLADCTGKACPVRKPVLHDLTGDGKDELITAVDIDGRTSELRVYTVRRGQVVRVLARRAVLEGVEVAAGHLAIREPTSNPEYVSVSDYIWDDAAMDGKGAMVLSGVTLDECRSRKSSDEPCPKVLS
ncbi:hypothetical protein [Streptomyces sp. NBC_01304]|uniref:hypothetical protein n=1 Tax=Streptomyces sp. NBC_01304 TaxID=2903818 RepID=UPI002E0EA51F|nr:hypothetical protein OG430_24450 [Streptomyces sp. NBC_01304]